MGKKLPDRKLDRKKQWAKADALWRKVIKLRAKGKCEWCGKQGIDCHHMVGRRSFVLRCDPSNGVYLCKSCHMRFHNIDASFGWDKFKNDRRKDYNRTQDLKNKTLKDIPIDVEALCEYLTAAIEKMENAE